MPGRIIDIKIIRMVSFVIETTIMIPMDINIITTILETIIIITGRNEVRIKNGMEIIR